MRIRVMLGNIKVFLVRFCMRRQHVKVDGEIKMRIRINNNVVNIKYVHSGSSVYVYHMHTRVCVDRD